MQGGRDNPSGMTQKDEGGAGLGAASSNRPGGKQMGEQTSPPSDMKGRGNKKAAGQDRKRSDKSAERGREETGDRDTDHKSAQSKHDSDRKSAESGDRDRMDRDRKSAESGDRDRMDRDRKSAESGDRDHMDRDRKSEGGKGATAKIGADQEKKVRTYFSENKPHGKRFDKRDVSVSIGIGIPATIALTPVPPGIVVVAADCPLQYFVWGDDVVLVDSCSREVVDIIPNVG
jgi:hypothetical protein